MENVIKLIAGFFGGLTTLLLAVVPLSDVFDSYREILTYAVSTRPNSRSAAAS